MDISFPDQNQHPSFPQASLLNAKNSYPIRLIHRTKEKFNLDVYINTIRYLFFYIIFVYLTNYCIYNLSKPNKKYRAIFETARKLFWKHGFRRVTVEEICQKANVSKMTFYKHFSNKDELALAIIEKIYEENMKLFHEMMHSDLPFEEKMELQVRMKMEGTKDISEEFVRDIFDDTDSEIHKYWITRANEAIKEVVQYYMEAQKKGWIRKDLSIDFMLYMINKFFEYSNDEHLISKYATMQDLIVEINKFFLYGILPREKCRND